MGKICDMHGPEIREEENTCKICLYLQMGELCKTVP
jgi:hypothetical protein